MNYTTKESTEITFRVNYMTNHGDLEVSETIMGHIEVSEELALFIFSEYAWNGGEPRDLHSWSVDESRVLCLDGVSK